MATAVVSLALQADARVVSEVLLWLAVAAFVGLSVRVALAATAGGDRLIREVADPGRAIGSLCLVAAAGALSTRLHTSGNLGLAGALGAIAVASSLALVPAVVSTVARNRARIATLLSGTWLLAVVATQALAIVVATFARTTGTPGLAAAGAAAWLLGIAIYLVLVGPLARRLVVRRRFTPDYWILMGALAISALAATVLVHAPGTPARSAIRAGGLVAWAGACGWLPVLTLADLRSSRRGSGQTPPARMRWSMVFPLAMFSASAQAYGRVDHAPALTRVGTVTGWIALAAWAVVAASVAREWPS